MMGRCALCARFCRLFVVPTGALYEEYMCETCAKAHCPKAAE